MSLLRLLKWNGFFGMLAVVGQLSACSLTGVNPPTERKHRLELNSWTLPTLSPTKTLEAKGALLERVVIEKVGANEFLVSALLDTDSSGHTPVRAEWTLQPLHSGNEGQERPSPPLIEPLTPRASGSSALQARILGGGDWTGKLDLIRMDRTLVTLDFRRPQEPAKGSWPMLRKAGTVPLDMAACRDDRLPWQVGDHHIGCTPKAGEVFLDRRVSIASGRTFPFPIEHRNEQDEESTYLRPQDLYLGPNPDDGLLWRNTSTFGWWPASKRRELRLPRAATRGEPSRSAGSFAFARPDRIEVGEVEGGARSLLSAQPADGANILAIEPPWLTFVEQRDGRELLVLRHLKRGRQAVVPTQGAPTRPLLLGSWLLWEDEGGVHGWSLEGGRAWSVPIRTDQSLQPTRVDDWLLLRQQAGARSQSVAIHVPSGQVHHPELSGDSRRVEARGAGAGHLSLWERVAPPSGHITLFALDDREFDPRGPKSKGDPLYERIPGGDASESFAPAAAWLRRGGERTLSLDPGFHASLVEAWVARGDHPVSIDITRNELLLARTENLPVPEGTERGNWVPLGVLPATPRGTSQEREVTLRWYAATEAGTVSKLRLRRYEDTR